MPARLAVSLSHASSPTARAWGQYASRRCSMQASQPRLCLGIASKPPWAIIHGGKNDPWGLSCQACYLLLLPWQIFIHINMCMTPVRQLNTNMRIWGGFRYRCRIRCRNREMSSCEYDYDRDNDNDGAVLDTSGAKHIPLTVDMVRPTHRSHGIGHEPTHLSDRNARFVSGANGHSSHHILAI
jgi:hypothetical protein